MLKTIALVLKTIAFATLIGSTAACTARAQSKEEIAKPSSLGDMALGSKDATVTMIEYGSVTCDPCATFANNVFPKIKTNYIDTGKIRFVFREFSLDKVGLTAFAKVRCLADADSPKYFSLIGALFRQQSALIKMPTDTIDRVSGQAGFNATEIKECVDDEIAIAIKQNLLDDLKYAYETLKVSSVPTFFVNGKLIKGEISFEEFVKTVKPLLGN